MPEIERFDGQANIERLVATLRGEPVDRVPHFEVLIEDLHVEKLLGRKAGNTLGVAGNPAKGSEAAESAMRPMFARDYLELCRIIGQDAIAVEAFWTPLKRVRADGSTGAITDRTIKSRADMARIIWPGEAEMEERLQYVREYVAAAKGTGIGVIFGGCCIFQTLYEFVIGLSDCMLMIMEDRDFFEELMSRSADYFAELLKRAIAEGIDVFEGGDDFAFKNGLFVRPQIFKEIWRPYWERILAPAHEAGIPVIFHSDGRIDAAMDMLIEMGVDCITPMDPSGVDYRDYKKRYGSSVGLLGNIDIGWPLVNGTPEDVDRDVKEHMDVLKPGGRWVAATSHSVVNYIPHENLIAMISAFHRYGRY